MLPKITRVASVEAAGGALLGCLFGQPLAVVYGQGVVADEAPWGTNRL